VAAARHPRGAVKSPLGLALALAAALMAVLALLHWAGVGLQLLLALAIGCGLLTWMFPWYGVRLLDAVILFLRGRYWAAEEGRFHSFGGVPLQIEDDGRHVWLDGPGLQRVLGRREPEDVLAARLAGQWRRNPGGTLMLRVDGVVQHLADMPGRNDPRVQKLRRYLEREVLFPAQQRRQRR